MIEGNFRSGMRVALFDDVITSGGSIIKGAKQVEADGGKVEVIMAVWTARKAAAKRSKAMATAFCPFLPKKTC